MLAALDREKPLPAQLLLAVPSDPVLHPRFVRLWREWGHRSIEPLCRVVRQWNTRDHVDDPHSQGSTRIERLRRLSNDLRVVRDPGFWEAGGITPGEAALLPNLAHQLCEAHEASNSLVGDETHPGNAH